MKRPSWGQIGQFILIASGVLLIEKLARVMVFDGTREMLSGGDIAIAIAAAVMVSGGWLDRRRTSR